MESEKVYRHIFTGSEQWYEALSPFELQFLSLQARYLSLETSNLPSQAVESIAQQITSKFVEPRTLTDKKNK